MGRRFTLPHRVRYHECDQQGAVFNANYLTWFDVALTEAWREALGTWEEFTARGLDLMVAEANLRYLSPARFDDEVEIDWSVSRLGNTAISSAISVRRGEELLTEGAMRHVVVDTRAGGKAPIPDDVRTALEPYVVEATPAA